MSVPADTAAPAPPDPGAPARPAITRLRTLVTAAEAYPVFERCFLDAQTEIRLSFRIFDLRTKLRSPEARRIGETWFDLIAHTLRRGVAIHVVLADFDPIAATQLHFGTWRSVRQFAFLAELAPVDRLNVIAARHPSRASFWPRLIGHAMLRKHLVTLIARVNAQTPPRRRRVILQLPGLRAYRDGDAMRLGRRSHLPHLFPVTHHQKLAVFDRTQLYIGGLDLDERRFDTPAHRRAADETWQDVQCLVEGPVVEAAQRHLESFLDVVDNRCAAPPVAPGFLRTISSRPRRQRLRIAPDTRISEIEAAHLSAARWAEQLIYLETQFFRDRGFARALARRARACPSLHLILLLPGAPDDVAFSGSQSADARFGEFLQGQCLRILRRGFGARLLVVSPVKPRETHAEGRDTLEDAPIIYVHSKVSVFDDSRAIVSSANLNGRSLRWDTEAGLDITQPDQIAGVRKAVMGAWLPADPDPALTAPETAFAAWQDLAATNAVTSPEKRRGLIVPHDPTPGRRFGRPMPGMPDEIV
jgi:phospholipase D1/2